MDSTNPNFITVTTPAGTTMQATNSAFSYGSPAHRVVLQGDAEPFPDANVDLTPALTYVRRVQTRYANDPDKYRKFLDILTDKSLLVDNDVRGVDSLSVAVAILSARRPRDEVVARVIDFFQDTPDLFQEFCEFLPEEEIEKVRKAGLLTWTEGKTGKRKADGISGGAAGSGSALPQKRKRKPVDREKEREREREREQKEKERETTTASAAAVSKATQNKVSLIVVTMDGRGLSRWADELPLFSLFFFL